MHTQPAQPPHISAHQFSALESLQMRLAQIFEQVSSAGWMSVIKQMVFFRRRAIVVTKDLAEIVERPELLENCKMKVIDLDEAALASGEYEFAVRSRRLKAAHYLDAGYRGVALVRNNQVIGDTWYIPSQTIEDPHRLHKDVRRFGFTRWQQDHVYTFDIFVAPEERKGKVAPAFQNEAMLRLRAQGYTRAFGFYWADNLPAHWCTRVTNKWKKVREVSVSRLLLMQWSNAIPDKGSGQPESLPT